MDGAISLSGGGDTFLEESQFSEIDGHYIEVDLRGFVFSNGFSESILVLVFLEITWDTHIAEEKKCKMYLFFFPIIIVFYI